MTELVIPTYFENGNFWNDNTITLSTQLFTLFKADALMEYFLKGSAPLIQLW